MSADDDELPHKGDRLMENRVRARPEPLEISGHARRFAKAAGPDCVEALTRWSETYCTFEGVLSQLVEHTDKPDFCDALFRKMSSAQGSAQLAQGIYPTRTDERVAEDVAAYIAKRVRKENEALYEIVRVKRAQAGRPVPDAL